ncbi:hypothetical protein BGZ72_001943 [Mortierella alpina]|nr:hypothetical protein BGZ72_001943 [Mortierella alpina]
MPIFDGLFQSWRSPLSPQQALKLAKFYLTSAGNADEPAIALALCEQAEMCLDRVKRPKSSSITENEGYRAFREEVAAAYIEHARLMAKGRYPEKEQASRTKSEKWGGVSSKDEATALGQLVSREDTPFPEDIFHTNVARPTIAGCEPPQQVNKQLADTIQLTYCLTALDTIVTMPEVELSEPTRQWIQAVEKDQEEERRLRVLVKKLVREFTRDEIKDADAVAEVTFVAPVLEKADFRFLLKLFVTSLKDSALLELHSLEGITRLLCSATGTIGADDLVRTLRHINTNFQTTHNQSEDHIYKLTTTVSRVLDAMADSHVTGIERENLQEPLRDYLDGLKGSDDPYLVFHAAYAFQALLCVPNDETTWQAIQRKAGRIINGTFQLVGAVKALDVNEFINGLCTLQTGLGEMYDVALKIKGAYEEAKSLCDSGRELKAALLDVSFNGKRAWYTALRGADTLLRNGQLAEFKKLVCEAPCRRALAFQWGMCLRLGNLAIDPQWNDKHRKDAVAFLGHLYRDDDYWGHHVPVKQLILDILMQLSKSSESVAQVEAKALLATLKDDENPAKRAMFQSCLESGPSLHPLMAAMSPPNSSALLDKAQGKVDVEADLKRLKLACQQGRVEAVYIQPKAKASLLAPDTAVFNLKEKVDDFLKHEQQKVLLLLGESGVGKTTFNLELEYQLWGEYQRHQGRIPLFISLPAVVRPEQDLIAKQLRKLQFEEPQLRELKKRKFVLICDGYDESQQTHNLYTSNRLNQEGEWQAQMVISCRSEYVGVDYKDRFQPGDRNQSSGPGQFQEAVVVPFNRVQIGQYIKSFVDLEKPLWSVENYRSVLDKIPSLRDLVKNPFLLKLSLDVLPHLVEPGQKDLAAAKVTRVALYDQFIEQWFERGKKRLVGKDMTGQERRAFESLSDEGFALHGIAFLKRLAADIYDKQGGNPVIEYSRVEVEGSWKDKYFSRDDDIQLLRDACPLTRTGNQYRFVHRSILEYGVARAVHEPQNGGIGVEKPEAPTSTSKRRGSMDSAYSFEAQGALHDNACLTEQGPDPNSPLVRRSFVGEPSVLQFLEERAQQEELFREQLHAYINASKSDAKKWRIAAANAVTILVRSGEQFNGADLQGIHVPGADISFGMFDSAQLQKADLRKVKLSNVWLGGASLSGAKMSGAEFGELPYLQEDGAVSRCIYSPNGETFMTVLETGGANVYSALTREKKWSVPPDVKIDARIAFSPDSAIIATFVSISSTQVRKMEAENQQSSEDEAYAVHLWQTEAGSCRTLLGHTARITGIAFSPKSDMIASCSDDDTIRLWDTKTGTCRRQYVSLVGSIAFSPKENRLAVARKDRKWLLWDVDKNNSIQTIYMEAHSHISQILYSPTGTKIAFVCTHHSSSYDVYLWDVRSRTFTNVGSINDHSMMRFRSIVFSLKGDNIAAISEDGTRVMIWSTETAESRHILESNGEEYLDAAFSPQGDLIATGGRDQMVRLWDVETGVCRGSMSGHSGIIRSVAFSLDGRHIASSGDDTRVRLWEVETGTTRTNSSGLGHTQLSVGPTSKGDIIISVSGGDTVHVWNMETGVSSHSLTEQGVHGRSIALSPSGKQIASGTTSGKIHLRNLEDGKLPIPLDCDGEEVTSIAFSPEGNQIASSSGQAIDIWDTKTGECLKHSPGCVENEKIIAIAFSPKADQFASVVETSEVVRLWDVVVGNCRILQGHANWITGIEYSPKGEEIASVSLDKTIRLWDTTSGECRLVLSGHEDMIFQALYSPDGAEIASCSLDETVRIWNVETGENRITLVSTTLECVSKIAYSTAGDAIASTDRFGTVQLWDVKTGNSVSVLQDDDNPNDINGIYGSCPNILFSSRGQLMASYQTYRGKVNRDGRLRGVKLWNVATGEFHRTFEVLPKGATPLFSPNGYQIACHESETAVRVWDVESGACLYTLDHEGVINDVQYSAKGDRIASASQDETVKLWDAKTGVCLHRVKGHRSGVERIAFSPKGDQIVLGGEDGSIRLWDMTSESLRRYFVGHLKEVTCVVFSPAPGKHLLASGSDDTIVCLWDLDSESPRRVFEGHTLGVLCIAFSPGGKNIASGSKDKSIRLWDVEAGTCFRTKAGASDEILCLAYSPKGELLAWGSKNMSVHLWNVASEQSWMVIEGGYGNVTSLAWGTAVGTNFLATGNSDTSVRVWRIVQDDGKAWSARLHWSSSHRALYVAGCDLQGVKGLTEANKQLLKQREATGDPQRRPTFKTASAVVLATSRRQKLGKTEMSSEETLAASTQQKLEKTEMSSEESVVVLPPSTQQKLGKADMTSEE